MISVELGMEGLLLKSQQSGDRIMSSRPAWATQGAPVSNAQSNNNANSSYKFISNSCIFLSRVCVKIFCAYFILVSCNLSSILDISSFDFFLQLLGFELRAYTLSHSTSPLFV
jgi:hypothetical protein